MWMVTFTETEQVADIASKMKKRKLGIAAADEQAPKRCGPAYCKHFLRFRL